MYNVLAEHLQHTIKSPTMHHIHESSRYSTPEKEKGKKEKGKGEKKEP